MALLQREEMERSVVYRHTLSNTPHHSPYRPTWPMGWTDDSAQFGPTASPLKTIYLPSNNNCMQVRQPKAVRRLGSPLPTKQQQQHSPSSLSQEETPNSQLMCSAMSRNSTTRDETPITSEQVFAALVSLASIGVSAAVLCVLCVQVLLSLQYYGYKRVEDQWPTIPFLFDVAATLCLVAFSLSICAFFTSVFQLFLCLKVLKMSPDSHMRIMRFLREAMFVRFLAFVGFFVSIPLFLLGVVATMLSVSAGFGSFASAGVLVVVALVALIICVAVTAHGVYAWLFGSLKLPEFADGASPKLVIDRNLSTLV